MASQGSLFKQTRIYPTQGCFHTRFSILADPFLREKIGFLFTFLCKFLTLFMAHPPPKNFYFNENETILSYVVFTKITAFLSKWFFKRRLKASPREDLTPTNCGPTLYTLGFMIYRNLNLQLFLSIEF